MALTPQPSELYEWATAPDPADIAAPLSGVKASGLDTPGQIVTRQWFNWLGQKASEWIKYFRDLAAVVQVESYIPGTGDELRVVADGSMTLLSEPGWAYVQGRVVEYAAGSVTVSTSGLSSGQHRWVVISGTIGGLVNATYGGIGPDSAEPPAVVTGFNRVEITRFIITSSTVGISPSDVPDLRQRFPISSRSITPASLPESVHSVPTAAFLIGGITDLGASGGLRTHRASFSVVQRDFLSELPASVFGGSGMQILATLYRRDAVSVSPFVASSQYKLVDPAIGVAHRVSMRFTGAGSQVQVAEENFGSMAFYVTAGTASSRNIDFVVPTGVTFPGGDFLLRLEPFGPYPGLSRCVRFTLPAIT